MVADVPARPRVQVHHGGGGLPDAEPGVPADHEGRGAAVGHDVLGGDPDREAVRVQRVAEVNDDREGVPGVGAQGCGESDGRAGRRGRAGGARQLRLEQAVHGMAAAVVEAVGHALELSIRTDMVIYRGLSEGAWGARPGAGESFVTLGEGGGPQRGRGARCSFRSSRGSQMVP
jgi:hypothetical protein